MFSLFSLGSDPKLREEYLNFYGDVRVGKLLQDFDVLSVWCGFKYYKGHSERPPFLLVTAFVDSIDFSTSHVLNPKQDWKLRGFISWVGTTSLEATIFIEQEEPSGEWAKKVESLFIMVARSVNDQSPAILNKMIPQNDTEKWYFVRGEQNKTTRKNQQSESLFNTSPTAEEREIIHDTFLKTIDPNKAGFLSRVKPDNTIWMEDTRLKNLVICHPEYRNMYNKIFGGYLMKEAFELAWANACIYIKCNPIIVNVEDIIFRKPVEIGSLLYLSSIVVYSSERHLQTRVVAEVYDPKTGTVEATNIFYFLFSSNKSIPR